MKITSVRLTYKRKWPVLMLMFASAMVSIGLYKVSNYLVEEEKKSQCASKYLKFSGEGTYVGKHYYCLTHTGERTKRWEKL